MSSTNSKIAIYITVNGRASRVMRVVRTQPDGSHFIDLAGFKVDVELRRGRWFALRSYNGDESCLK